MVLWSQGLSKAKILPLSSGSYEIKELSRQMKQSSVSQPQVNFLPQPLSHPSIDMLFQAMIEYSWTGPKTHQSINSGVSYRLGVSTR